MHGPPHAFQETVNVASTQLAPALLSAPTRTLGGVRLLGGAGTELSAFLSLVTGFLDKIPAITPGIEAPPSAPSGAAVRSNNIRKDSRSDLSKDSKSHKKEESAALLLAPAVPEPAAFIAKPPLAFELPEPELGAGGKQFTCGGNGTDDRSLQHPDLTPKPLLPALPVPTKAAGEVAFALRLTPNGSETTSSRSLAVRAGVEQAEPTFPRFSPIPEPMNAHQPLPSSPRAVAAEMFHPEPKQSVAEPAAKREFPWAHLNDGHVEGNALPLSVNAQPPDAAGITGTRVGHSALAESHVLPIASDPETKPGVAPPPARQISLKLNTNDSNRVNVDLTERAGKVQVAVRTPDHELAKSLQTDLGDLVGRLQSKGFKTETWIPAGAQAAVLSPPSSSNPGFGQPQHSGFGPGGGQQHQQQHGSNQRQQARWTAQLEETLSANDVRSENQ